jgi:hypothetical protein
MTLPLSRGVLLAALPYPTSPIQNRAGKNAVNLPGILASFLARIASLGGHIASRKNRHFRQFCFDLDQRFDIACGL